MDLATFNAAPAPEVTRQLLACCDVTAWAEAVLAGRPYDTVDDLGATADRAARRLGPADVDRALAAHPRIGDRAGGPATDAAWSRQEQSGVATDSRTRTALLDGNRAYEERFGRVFLICATGLDAEQILGALRTRLGHDDATEAAVVADELRKIALLRLRKVVEP
jgi:2-oxo-4-hydroxy-4-carboxy-5-ureidoimidazoline decarboxylase